MLIERKRVLFKETVGRQTLVGSGRAKILVFVIGHALVEGRIGLVQHAPAADAEGVLSAAASQEGRILFTIDIDIVGSPVGPAGRVIANAHAVSKAQ